MGSYVERYWVSDSAGMNKAARSAVLALEEAGVLHQRSKNRKSGIYVAREVVDALNAYERALATTSTTAAAWIYRSPLQHRRDLG